MGVPLRKRRLDLVLVAFFVLNALVITYVIDLEQLVIADPVRFDYPLWPPAPMIDLVHWYGRHYDPLLMARPPFWQATIWIDVLLFGPFYVAATYAFWRGRDWIRVPALVWAGLMMANVTILMFEEWRGSHASPNLPVVLAANASWFAFPLLVIWRLRRDRPFS
jgi:EXPERA (EXPanded EBP superfamily)